MKMFPVVSWGACSLLLTVLATPTVAWAQADAQVKSGMDRPSPRFTAAVDVEWMRVRDGGYRLFSDRDSLSAAGLSLSYELLRPTPRVALAVGLGLLDADEEDHEWGAGETASLDLDTYYAFGVASFAWRPWFQPFIKLGAGGTRGQVTLAFPAGTDLVDNSPARWSVFGRASAGLRLRTRPFGVLRGRGVLALSIAGEYGWQVGSSFGFSVAPPEPTDETVKEDRIPTSGIAIGSLGRTFMFWRLAFGLHF